MQEFTPEDWIAAGYTRFEKNPAMDGYALFGLQKCVRDEDGSNKRYYITVMVYDLREMNGRTWGFSPKVQFNHEVTTDISLHTDDPKVAEERFDVLWKALDRPYYEQD